MNQAVLITGGARRLGRVIALYLAERGYDVALHYHTSREAAERTQAEINALGAACELFQADLCDLAALPGLVAQVAAAFPQCRALVNNASLFERGGLMESDADSFERHWRVNLMAPVMLTQAFARAFAAPCHPEPQAKDDKTTLSVVNLLDAKMDATRHSFFAYLLSKKALRDFTLMTAAELGPRIRVNGVAPGMVMAGDPPFDEAYRQKLALTLPSRKAPEPDEVAEAVHTLLISPLLTGQIVYVDGGEGII